MAIAYSIAPTHMCTDCYYAELQRREDAGIRFPDGLIVHLCMGSGDNLRAFEVWESRGAAHRFLQLRKPPNCSRGTLPGVPEPVLWRSDPVVSLVIASND